ncbi:MAG: mechanosensitive ion channel, partial [Gemmatimonadota bacterium]
MTFGDFVPALVTLVLLVGSLWLTDRTLRRRSRVSEFARQGVLVVATLAGVMVVLLLLPDELADDQSVLQLLGLAVTVVLALGSTTMVANAMAGLMLRSVGSFDVGDFIRTGDHFGRVSERGLFHTEIQTENRDLTTLPNQFLVS